MSYYQTSVDDNDPSVLYGDGWVLVTSDPPWSGTMHSTSEIGASVRFRFTGSAVAVVCIIPTGGEGQRSIASFSLDGGPPVTISHLTTGPVQFNKIFWQREGLEFGSHVVEMRNVAKEAYLRLDRFDYDPTDRFSPKTTPPGPHQPPTPSRDPGVVTQVTTVSPPTTVVTQVSSARGSSPSSSEPSGSSSPQSVSTDIQFVTVPGQSSPSASTILSVDGVGEKQGSSVAAVVGGVLGGLLALVLIGLVAFILLRRRRRKNKNPGCSDDANMKTHDVPTPFLLTPGSRMATPTSASFMMSSTDEKTGLHDGSYHDTESSSGSGSQVGGSNTVYTSYQASVTVAPSDSMPLSPLRRQEAPRFSQIGGFGDAPPAYYPGTPH